MKLIHKMIRYFIYAGVVVLTSSFLIYELITSYNSMKGYMYYIIEKTGAAFLYDKYQNQNIVSSVMRAFNTQRTERQQKEFQLFCKDMEKVSNIKGFNISDKVFFSLHGTLQTRNSDCSQWINDLPGLMAFDRIVRQSQYHLQPKKELIIVEDKFHYYIDIQYQYIYTYNLVNSAHFFMSDALFWKENVPGITGEARKKLFDGDSIISSIYKDPLTQQNIMSFFSPVYEKGNLKGFIVVNLNKDNLVNIIYTQDRPLVWKYLNVKIMDTDNPLLITVNKSRTKIFNYVTHTYEFPGNTRIFLSLDFMYFIATSWRIFLFYIICTLLLLHLVKMHFRHYRSVSEDNISDAMTGLYNRKLLTPLFESRLQRRVEAGASIIFMALDCDRLKYINDTWGHKEGDRAIIMLSQAIAESIRKTDYAIRLGGDEFCMILIDYEIQRVNTLPARISEKLATIDPLKRIKFSWGVHQMRKGETIDDAYKASDAQLYIHKNRRKENTKPVFK